LYDAPDYETHPSLRRRFQGQPRPGGHRRGLVSRRRSEPLAAIGENIGKTTNNVAEYQALIRGLREALLKGADQIEVRTDSELMARQIQGRYKVNSPDLLPCGRRPAC
jgi:ribonuclease HI